MAASLLAVDLDGTLLARTGEPHEVDVVALRAARRAGVVVTIITGRLFPGTIAAAQRLGLDDAVGCADGSHLVHVDGQTLEHAALVGDHAALIRRELEARPMRTFVFARDTIVHDEEGAPFLDYVKTWSPRFEQTRRVLDHHAWEHDHGVTAVVGLAEEQHVSSLVGAIESRLAQVAQIISFPLGKTGLWGFITRARTSDKGTALHYLARRAGVPEAQTVAVGDWLNDVPMFRAAGRSFSMGQAPAEVKAAASAVLTETAETGGGIATVVREVFGVRF